MQEHETPAQELARQIREATQASGLTLASVLASIGISDSTLRAWEGGRVESPKMGTYRMAERVLAQMHLSVRKAAVATRVDESILPLTRHG